MKLLFCRWCGDVRKLQAHRLRCACGRVWGKYKRDGAHAEVSHEAIVLGLDNYDLEKEVLILNGNPPGDATHRIACWVYPYNERVEWKHALTEEVIDMGCGKKGGGKKR